jgi:Zn-dependent protease
MAFLSPFALAVMAVPVLLSLTLHEFAHARVALAFGDDTAKRMGRVSLNPLVHLDPLGTICLFLGPVGWAKPVPVVASNLRPPRLGDLAVSLAGVGMNLLLAFASAAALTVMALLRVEVARPGGAVAPAGVLALMLFLIMRISLALMVFNLIPLYPLDGHHVLRELLPARLHGGFMAWQVRFGRYLLLGLILLPWLTGLFDVGVYINPLGIVLGRVMGLSLRLLPEATQVLVANTLNDYAHYLLY